MTAELGICGHLTSNLCLISAATTGILKLVKSKAVLWHNFSRSFTITTGNGTGTLGATTAG